MALVWSSIGGGSWALYGIPRKHYVYIHFKTSPMQKPHWVFTYRARDEHPLPEGMSEEDAKEYVIAQYHIIR